MPLSWLMRYRVIPDRSIALLSCSAISDIAAFYNYTYEVASIPSVDSQNSLRLMRYHASPLVADVTVFACPVMRHYQHAFATWPTRRH
jgi:hypothetical protein